MTPEWKHQLSLHYRINQTRHATGNFLFPIRFQDKLHSRFSVHYSCRANVCRCCAVITLQTVCVVVVVVVAVAATTPSGSDYTTLQVPP